MYIYSKYKRVNGPYNFNYVLTHYNIYPWINENDKLCRILRLKKNIIVKVEITSQGTLFNTNLHIVVKSVRRLSPTLLKKIIEKISWCLFIDDEYTDYYEICKKDPILTVALEEKNYGRGKLYPDIFEGIIGVVLSQNVSFSRIYKMMKNLCIMFGEYTTIDGVKYHAFPVPEDIAIRSIEEIRRCKVGYRAKYIKQIAEKIKIEQIDLEKFRELNNEDLKRKLMEFPGIGRYSADLIMGVAFKRNVYHIDSYVRKVIKAAYFHNEEVDDNVIDEFVQQKWGKFASLAIDALTTNTEIWSEKIGLKIGVKSGAKGGV